MKLLYVGGYDCCSFDLYFIFNVILKFFLYICFVNDGWNRGYYLVVFKLDVNFSGIYIYIYLR